MSSAQAIPERKIRPEDLATTPGGTIFATTPGGTKIFYDKQALLYMSNSPLARTPPSNLPIIPGITKGGSAEVVLEHGKEEEEEKHSDHDEMFDME